MSTIGKLALRDRQSRKRDGTTAGTMAGTTPEGDGTEIPGTLPGFAISASEELEDLTSGAEGRSPAQTRLAIADALSASQPVTRPDRFSGRRHLLSNLIAAVEQQRAHVVLYGERGIGKTSLVHIFTETARQARYLVLYTSCGAEASFDEIFRNFAKEIPLLYHASISPRSDEAEHRRTFADLLDPAPLDPRMLSELFAKLVGTRVILVLDEYDRIASRNFRRNIAELIKNLSDRAARVQIVLVGVASNLDELVGFTPSIRRNIAGIAVGPMPEKEMLEILDRAEHLTGMTFAEPAKALILRMANGSPYLVRLLANRASGATLDGGRTEIGVNDVRSSTETILTEWKNGLPHYIQTQLSSSVMQEKWPILIAAAHMSGTPDGWFTPADIASELQDAPEGTIESELDHLMDHAALFERSVEGGYEGESRITQYRFRNQGLAQFLSLSAALARTEGVGGA